MEVSCLAQRWLQHSLGSGWERWSAILNYSGFSGHCLRPYFQLPASSSWILWPKRWLLHSPASGWERGSATGFPWLLTRLPFTLWPSATPPPPTPALSTMVHCIVLQSTWIPGTLKYLSTWVPGNLWPSATPPPPTPALSTMVLIMFTQMYSS